MMAASVLVAAIAISKLSKVFRMSIELFYVMASAPATFSVGGKIYNMVGGETRGPFTKTEINQVLSSTDRQRLQLINYTGSKTAPKVAPSENVDQIQEVKPVKELKDPLYKGVASVTVESSSPDYDSTLTEPINFFPDTEPSVSIEEAKQREESTVGTTVPEPETEPNKTSFSEQTVTETPSAETSEETSETSSTSRRTSRRRRNKSES